MSIVTFIEFLSCSFSIIITGNKIVNSSFQSGFPIISFSTSSI